MLTKINSMHKQRGISLLEVMLSLAIIAIILVMATRYFGLASQNSKVNQAISEFNEVKQAIQQYYNAQGAFPNSLSDLSTRGLLTPQTAQGSTPWSASGLSVDNAGNTIMANVPAEQCQNLAHLFTGGGCSGSTVTVPFSTNPQPPK